MEYKLQQLFLAIKDKPANLHKVETNDVDKNLKGWAKTFKDYRLPRRQLRCASDAHAADIYQHHPWYVKLRGTAHAVDRRNSVSTVYLPFDPIVYAQIIALIEHFESNPFNPWQLRLIYQQLINEQGHPCQNKNEPHSTRFKEHLNLLPDLSPEFSKGFKGRENIYIRNKSNLSGGCIH